MDEDKEPATLEDYYKQRQERLEREKKPCFWWHWQNLKEDTPKAWVHGRGWFHSRRSNAELGISWLLPSRFTHAYLRFGGHHQMDMSIACPLFAFWFHLDGIPRLQKWKLTSGYQAREIGWTFHEWSLHWRVFTNPDEWSKKTPRWRDGWCDFRDLFLGKAKHSKHAKAEQQVDIMFPEGVYPATVKLFTSTWKRSRWPFVRRIERAEIGVEGGVPVPGKGEDAWNCEDTATMSLTCPANTVEEAIEHFKQSVERTRERYGGKNWTPEGSRA